jgi:hypothetical protein
MHNTLDNSVPTSHNVLLLLGQMSFYVGICWLCLKHFHLCITLWHYLEVIEFNFEGGKEVISYAWSNPFP